MVKTDFEVYNRVAKALSKSWFVIIIIIIINNIFVYNMYNVRHGDIINSSRDTKRARAYINNVFFPMPRIINVRLVYISTHRESIKALFLMYLRRERGSH